MKSGDHSLTGNTHIFGYIPKFKNSLKFITDFTDFRIRHIGHGMECNSKIPPHVVSPSQTALFPCGDGN
jgi:hypothetical protein